MVHLTFIHQAQLGSDFKVPPSTAEGIFLLSKMLTVKFGEPQQVYCQEHFGSKVNAKISNLAFHVSNIVPTTALNESAPKREISAFFDFILGEADYCGFKHIVIVCSSQVMDNIFIKHPPMGSSCTISGNRWSNILIDYSSLWLPLKSDNQTDDDLNLVTDYLFNGKCSLSEKELINQTSISARFSEYGT